MPFEFPWTLHPPPGIAKSQWFIILALGFALIAFIVWRFVLPMVGGYLSERQQAIADAASQVEETLRDTEMMRNDYRQRLEAIEDETERRMEEAIREAESLRERLLEEARQNAESLIRRGEEEVARERAKAAVLLRAQFVEGVIRAAEYAAARSLDETQQRRLVEEFVQKVGARS